MGQTSSSIHIEPHIRKCCHTFANYSSPTSIILLICKESKLFTSPNVQMKKILANLYEVTYFFTENFMLSSRFPFCTANSMTLMILLFKTFAVISRSSVQHLPVSTVSCIPAQRISAPEGPIAFQSLTLQAHKMGDSPQLA